MSAMAQYPDCLICSGVAGDPELHREQVWEDALWRLTASLASEVPGFCYLEPKRHIRDMTELDGEEARTLGTVLGRLTAGMKAATGSDFVYLYVFGWGIPHLHFHLAPHVEGDALNDRMIKGAATSTTLPSGAELITSAEFPPLPEAHLREAAAAIRTRLA